MIKRIFVFSSLILIVFFGYFIIRVLVANDNYTHGDTARVNDVDKPAATAAANPTEGIILPEAAYYQQEHDNNEIYRLIIDSDYDGDGIDDLEDIVDGARKDAVSRPMYKSVYYSGGYPPDSEGVCTDVIWRAFRNAGYLLKDMVDEDIEKHTERYPRVEDSPDPNIDFRRVKNLVSYFSEYARVLTTEIIPGDIENLNEWQGGDIVVFDDPAEHIAIVSDKRNSQGVPFIIHNAGPYTKEEDILLYWNEHISSINFHFRFPDAAGQ